MKSWSIGPVTVSGAIVDGVFTVTLTDEGGAKLASYRVTEMEKLADVMAAVDALAEESSEAPSGGYIAPPPAVVTSGYPAPPGYSPKSMVRAEVAVIYPDDLPAFDKGRFKHLAGKWAQAAMASGLSTTLGASRSRVAQRLSWLSTLSDAEASAVTPVAVASETPAEKVDRLVTEHATKAAAEGKGERPDAYYEVVKFGEMRHLSPTEWNKPYNPRLDFGVIRRKYSDPAYGRCVAQFASRDKAETRKTDLFAATWETWEKAGSPKEGGSVEPPAKGPAADSPVTSLTSVTVEWYEGEQIDGVPPGHRFDGASMWPDVDRFVTEVRRRFIADSGGFQYAKVKLIVGYNRGAKSESTEVVIIVGKDEMKTVSFDTAAALAIATDGTLSDMLFAASDRRNDVLLPWSSQAPDSDDFGGAADDFGGPVEADDFGGAADDFGGPVIDAAAAVRPTLYVDKVASVATYHDALNMVYAFWRGLTSEHDGANAEELARSIVWAIQDNTDAFGVFMAAPDESGKPLSWTGVRGAIPLRVPESYRDKARVTIIVNEYGVSAHARAAYVVDDASRSVRDGDVSRELQPYDLRAILKSVLRKRQGTVTARSDDEATLFIDNDSVGPKGAMSLVDYLGESLVLRGFAVEFRDETSPFVTGNDGAGPLDGVVVGLDTDGRTRRWLLGAASSDEALIRRVHGYVLGSLGKYTPRVELTSRGSVRRIAAYVETNDARSAKAIATRIDKDADGLRRPGDARPVLRVSRSRADGLPTGTYLVDEAGGGARRFIFDVSTFATRSAPTSAADDPAIDAAVLAMLDDFGGAADEPAAPAVVLAETPEPESFQADPSQPAWGPTVPMLDAKEFAPREGEMRLRVAYPDAVSFDCGSGSKDASSAALMRSIEGNVRHVIRSIQDGLIQPGESLAVSTTACQVSLFDTGVCESSLEVRFKGMNVALDDEAPMSEKLRAGTWEKEDEGQTHLRLMVLIYSVIFNTVRGHRSIQNLRSSFVDADGDALSIEEVKQSLATNPMLIPVVPGDATSRGYLPVYDDPIVVVNEGNAPPCRVSTYPAFSRSGMTRSSRKLLHRQTETSFVPGALAMVLIEHGYGADVRNDFSTEYVLARMVAMIPAEDHSRFASIGTKATSETYASGYLFDVLVPYGQSLPEASDRKVFQKHVDDERARIGELLTHSSDNARFIFIERSKVTVMPIGIQPHGRGAKEEKGPRDDFYVMRAEDTKPRIYVRDVAGEYPESSVNLLVEPKNFALSYLLETLGLKLDVSNGDYASVNKAPFYPNDIAEGPDYNPTEEPSWGAGNHVVSTLSVLAREVMPRMAKWRKMDDERWSLKIGGEWPAMALAFDGYQPSFKDHHTTDAAEVAAFLRADPLVSRLFVVEMPDGEKLPAPTVVTEAPVGSVSDEGALRLKAIQDRFKTGLAKIKGGA